MTLFVDGPFHIEDCHQARWTWQVFLRDIQRHPISVGSYDSLVESRWKYDPHSTASLWWQNNISYRFERIKDRNQNLSKFYKNWIWRKFNLFKNQGVCQNFTVTNHKFTRFGSELIIWRIKLKELLYKGNQLKCIITKILTQFYIPDDNFKIWWNSAKVLIIFSWNCLNHMQPIQNLWLKISEIS